MSNQFTDDTLIEALIKQDEKAVQYFMEVYVVPIAIYFSASFKLPTDSHKDISQDFYLHVSRDDWRALRLFDGRDGCRLHTYIRVLLFRFVDARYSKEQMHRFREVMKALNEFLLEAAHSMNFNKQSEIIEMKKTLLVFAAQQNKEQKPNKPPYGRLLVFLLEGMKVQEIADQLCVKRSLVDTWKKRLIELLQEKLKNKYHGI